MGLQRNLKPIAGALLSLGAGCTVVALGDPDSTTRSQATLVRREVVLTVLRRRLHGGVATGVVPTPPERPTKAISRRFYVVIGPDAQLTSLGRERVSLVLRKRAPAAMHRESGEGGDGPDKDKISPWRSARLALPHGCTLGTGQFSSLLEQQLLRSQDNVAVHHGGEPLAGSGLHLRKQQQQQQHQRQHDCWDAAANEDESANSLQPSAITSELQIPPLVSVWESFVLWATGTVLDGQQLDSAATWALERALAGSGVESRSAVDIIVSPSGSAADFAGGGSSKSQEVVHPSRAVDRSCSFVVEVRETAKTTGDGRGASGERSDQEALCGGLMKFGWRLASRGLASVVVSSSNPWVLAQLQHALQQVHGTTEQTSEEQFDDRSEGLSTKTSEDVSREVIVARVALPSSAERRQAVLAVADELGVAGRLSAADMTMLAELTGGRRAGLLSVLRRIQQSPLRVTAVEEACRAAIDDKARALATAWGLISGDPDTTADPEGMTAVGRPSGGTDTMQPSTEKLEVSAAARREAASGGSVHCPGRGMEGAPQRSREEWAPLWEVMRMLSASSVSVGTAAAGSAPGPSSPPGTAHPAELAEECALDGSSLLQLAREGWLELSPSAPAASGTILEEPGSMPITVHSAGVPLELLSRGVDRSFVGVPPLHLAGFRRLLDHRSWATPEDNSQNHGGVGGENRYEGRQVEDVISGLGRDVGSGVGGGEHMLVSGGSGGGTGWKGERKQLGGSGDSEVGIGQSSEVKLERPGDDQGLKRAEDRRGLERAGCLIEAAVLSREHQRQEAGLSEDGLTIAATWENLGTARRDLSQAGKSEELSDGEWAEVQLELIRQERAVMARALEMRARRRRIDDTRRSILSLEKRAALLLPSSTREESSPEISRTLPSGTQELAPPAHYINDCETGAHTRFISAGFPEEQVIRDVDGGTSLVPLMTGGTEKGDGRRRRDLGDSSGSGIGRGGDGGGGGDLGSGGGRGDGIVRIWRWIRGL